MPALNPRKSQSKSKARKTVRVHMPVHPSAHSQRGDHSALVAERARAVKQKTKWSLGERKQWWRQYPAVEMPMLPHPRAKVPEKEWPAAKFQAVEAMQEFGVYVEASRASGFGRWQLGYLLSKASPDQEFRQDMHRARRECQERLEGAFIQRGMWKGGDLAGIFYLKHNREKYREVTRLELTGKDGAPFNALESAKAEILTRLTKLAEESAGSRQGLEGKHEIVVGSRRPQLVKGAGETEVKRSGPRRAAKG